MPSFISPLTRDEEEGRERARATAVVAARAKTFFYLTLPPPPTTKEGAAPIFSPIQLLSYSDVLNYVLVLSKACNERLA